MNEAVQYAHKTKIYSFMSVKISSHTFTKYTKQAKIWLNIKKNWAKNEFAETVALFVNISEWNKFVCYFDDRKSVWRMRFNDHHLTETVKKWSDHF